MSTAEAIDFQTVNLADLEPSQAVRTLVEQAVELKASDIFLLSDENGLRVAIRRITTGVEKIERLPLLPWIQTRAPWTFTV